MQQRALRPCCRVAASALTSRRVAECRGGYAITRRAHSLWRHRTPPPVHADAADAASQPSEYIYPNLPGDASASFAYTALQTSSQDDLVSSTDAAASTDAEGTGSNGSRPPGSGIPQRWRVVIAIGALLHPSMSCESCMLRTSAPRRRASTSSYCACRCCLCPLQYGQGQHERRRASDVQGAGLDRPGAWPGVLGTLQTAA
jgi:hypothetical protein